tara:strand:+ start:393 stop:1535 length:1143 start_codon:yes stop_codon:yes gene_type:complete
MFLSYGKQSINNSDIKSVIKTLKSNYLTQGPEVEKFEAALRKKFNSKYSTVLINGSAAFLLISKILNWKKGDIIAVSPITFLSQINAIEHCNAKPLFIDISMLDYCMDPEKLELELKKDKSHKIKAAIITDYGGQPAQWEKFYNLKKKYKIKLINDNCHAIGSSINNNYGYAAKYADFATLSFHPVKAITTGEGGAILTNNKKFDEKAKLLRSHGIIKDAKKFWSYKMIDLGFNFRLPDINCALGLSQLKRLTKFVSKRKRISQIYNKFFSDKKKFIIPNNIKKNENSFHLYPLLINFNQVNLTKEKLLKIFLKYKIKLQVHYIPVNSQYYYKRKYGLNIKKFKNSFEFYKKEISLPIFYDLTNKQIAYFKRICKRIFKI